MVHSEILSIIRDGMVTGTMFKTFTALNIMSMTVLIFAIYIYSSIAWMIIAKKLKYKKSWLSWIPIANIAMILQLGGFPWALVFLLLIFVLGWVPLFILVIISTWRIFEKRKYPGWFSLSVLVPGIGGILYLMIIGFVAWKDRKKMLWN